VMQILDALYKLCLVLKTVMQPQPTMQMPMQ
jgi:hypothetical protein